MKLKFIDKSTDKMFEAEVISTRSGEVGYLVPIWVKSQPNTWERKDGGKKKEDS